MENKQAYCRSCGAPIRFIRTKNDKLMPVNMQEVVMRIMQGGRYRFVLKTGAVVSGEYAKRFSPGSFTAYEPHWGSCPAADEHRRKQ